MEEIIEQIRRLAPPFKQIDDELLIAWIEMSEVFVCEKKFKDNHTKAVALYALHLMTLDGAMKGEDEDMESYSQRLSSFELVGAYKKSFASMSSDNKSGNELLSTPFGKMYHALLRKSGGGFGLITAKGTRRSCR